MNTKHTCTERKQHSVGWVTSPYKLLLQFKHKELYNYRLWQIHWIYIKSYTEFLTKVSCYYSKNERWRYFLQKLLYHLASLLFSNFVQERSTHKKVPAMCTIRCLIEKMLTPLQLWAHPKHLLHNKSLSSVT